MEECIQAHLVRMQVDPNFVELLLFLVTIKNMDASPFSEGIQMTSVLEKFTILNFKLYSKMTESAFQYYHRVMSL